jgi:antitoxin (DNA-binding transcriptional repressor) of toxin-antitoxin stability system
MKDTNGQSMIGTTISIDQSQIKLAELIHQLLPGEEIMICENERPVAKLIKLPNPARTRRRTPGLCKGMISIISDDDDHLEDFKDYMP